MRALLTILLSLLTSGFIFAQNGFIKKYHMGGQVYVKFVDVIYEDDGNLIVYGFGLDTLNSYEQGFLIARFDTLGNILNYNDVYVANNGATGFSPVRDVIKTETGFAAVGSSFSTNEGVFLKFNHDLSLDTIQYYPVTNGGYMYDIQYIQPTPDGFFLGGSVGYLTAGLQPVIYKVDADGNLIWTKYYTDNTIFSNLLMDIIKLSENEYVIAGDSYPPFIPSFEIDFRGWMIGIDTSGSVLWQWENDTTQYSFGLVELLKAEDGWVSINAKIEWGPNNNRKYYSGITRLDENKEFLWDTPLGTGQPYASIGSGLLDIAQTIDSNWVAVGELIGDSLNARAAWMVAVTPDGDSLWARTDTLQHVTGTPYASGLHGLVVLPSGSIVAAGRTQHPNGRYYGLLIKTDPRGCIEPDCHPYMSILDATDNADDFNFELSPNPTSGMLRVTCPGVTPFSAEVYDGTGRVLATNPTMRCGDTLHVSHLPSGQYFIRVQSEGSASVVHSVIRL